MSDDAFEVVLSDHPKGVTIAVWVVPGASRTEIVGPHGNALRVRVSAPPEGGRANAVLVRELRRVLGVRGELLSGATSRRKRFLARTADRSGVRSALAAASTPR